MRDADHEPLAGVLVEFAVTGGPHESETAFGVTDGNGEAGFSYTGSTTGEDMITASVIGSALETAASKHWFNPEVANRAETLFVEPEETATNDLGEPHTITATVRDGDADAVAGAVVRFEVTEGPNEGLQAFVFTDANGEASITYTSETEPGDEFISVRVVGTNLEAQTHKLWIEVPEIVESPQSNFAGAAGSSGFPSWSNTDNAIGETTGTYATIVLAGGGTSSFLELTQYQFNIPDDAEVTGIEITIWNDADGGSLSILDNDVRLMLDEERIGNNKAKNSFPFVGASGSQWGEGTGPRFYGAEDDTWGVTLSGSDVNSGGFGISIQAANRSPTLTRTGGVAAAEITVYFTHD